MNNRNDTIDVLRIVMAYIIVVYHSFLLGLPYFPGGGIATEFFFIITGALMNRSIIKNDKVNLWGFIKKKIVKLIPLFWFTSVITLLCKWICGFKGIKSVVGDIVKNLFEFLFLRMIGVADQYFINPVAWYLSAMFISILLLYPIARKYREICSTWLFPLITIALCSFLIKEYGTVVTVSVDYSYFTLDLVKRAIAEICFGFSLYELSFRIASFRLTSVVSVMLKCTEIIGYFSVLIAAIFALDIKWSIWILLLLGVSVAISLSGHGVKLSIRNNKIKGWVAEYSLALYLSHYSVIIIMEKLKDVMKCSNIELLLIYLVIATIISIINMMIVSKVKQIWPIVIQIFVLK